MSRLEFCVYIILHQNWKHRWSVSQCFFVLFFSLQVARETVTTTTQTVGGDKDTWSLPFNCRSCLALFFRAEIWRRVGKTGQETVFFFFFFFFPQSSCHRLHDLWVEVCVISLFTDEWRILLGSRAEPHQLLSHPDGLSIHTGSVWPLCNYLHCQTGGGTKPSPLSASVLFAQMNNGLNKGVFGTSILVEFDGRWKLKMFELLLCSLSIGTKKK